jgi:hypothetical protein
VDPLKPIFPVVVLITTSWSMGNHDVSLKVEWWSSRIRVRDPATMRAEEPRATRRTRAPSLELKDLMDYPRVNE